MAQDDVGTGRLYRGLEMQRLDASEAVALPRARIHRAAVGGMLFDRAEFEPGWRWSEHAPNRDGAHSCQESHVGLIVSGALRVLMDDGTAHDLRAGDVYAIPPNHDTWTLGEESCVAIDITVAEDAGSPRRGGA